MQAQNKIFDLPFYIFVKSFCIFFFQIDNLDSKQKMKSGFKLIHSCNICYSGILGNILIFCSNYFTNFLSQAYQVHGFESNRINVFVFSFLDKINHIRLAIDAIIIQLNGFIAQFFSFFS